jgi:lysophospholipase L1-like esterase
MKSRSAEGVLGIALAVGAMALVAVLVLVLAGAALESSATPAPTRIAASIAESTSPTATAALPTDTTAPSQSTPPVPTLLPTPSATPTPPSSTPVPLPTMLASIGDSYGQAWGVSPAYPRDHPGFSWVIGSIKGDGVFSLRERFKSLGGLKGSNAVVNSATSGRKMSDAVRQATRVVSFAKALPKGSTVYVTFELGTNDICDSPVTSLATFDSQLRSAIHILEAGLPKGSRILMLSIPDFGHFHDLTQADPAAVALLAQRSHSRTCAPFLGTDSPLSMAEAEQVLADYDSSLAKVCGEVEAQDGPSGALHCLYNEAQLSFRDYTIEDLTTVDYFHPSLSGQEKLAAAAWKVDVWSGIKLPSGAAAFGPGGRGGEGGDLALAGVLLAPLLLRRRSEPA